MKKFKKTLTLFLALTICASFCTLNGNAVWYNFQAPTTTVFFDPDETEAYAEVHITDWATETNTTDLYAKTYADANEYEELYGELFISLAVEVFLAVELSDGSACQRTDYDSYDPSEEDVTQEDKVLLAHLDGTWYLNQDDHYSISFFEAEHILYLSRFTRWRPGSWTPTDRVDEEKTIHIGFTS